MRCRTYNALQVFAGIGGACKGFDEAAVEYKGVRARFRTIGAIDIDPSACETLEALCPGVRASRLDLFTREQYEAFHGEPPPEGWREVGLEDIVAASGGERPDVVFLSPPCKGFSGLLGTGAANTPKYQALNGLVSRGLFLVLEAFAHQLPGLIFLENVPRIADRGETLLDQVRRMLESYGYLIRMSVHDCGRIGGLGQHRRRFLLTARHAATVPTLLFEPADLPMKTIGQVVTHLGIPGLLVDGRLRDPLHVVPEIAASTWERLALIRAGKDWKDVGAKPKGDRPGVVGPRWAPGMWRIDPVGDSGIGLLQRADGAGNLGDVRAPSARRNAVLGVRSMDTPSGTVTGETWPANGAFSVADVRLGGRAEYANIYRVLADEGPSVTVTGASPTGRTLRVVSAAEPSPTVIGTADSWSSGSAHLADPMLGSAPRNGTFGVQAWEGQSATVTGSIDVHAGIAAVASPGPADQVRILVPGYGRIIISDDGCWHRPFSTRELAALQDFPDDLWLASESVVVQRMWIGNAVPRGAARFIGVCALSTLLAADEGGLGLPNGGGVWVRRPEGWMQAGTGLLDLAAL